MGVLHIDPHARYFAGHFPQRPIVPGVIELMLAIDHLAEQAKQRLFLRAIKFARLRHLVLPGDELAVSARMSDGGFTRVDVRRDSALVANAELDLSVDPPVPSLQPALDRDGVRVDAPPLELLLPHRPPMRLVTGIDLELAEGLQSTARISADTGLARAGRVPAVIALEAAAQTAAAWEGLRRSREPGGAGARVGYLVAIREVTFFTADIPVEMPLHATIELDGLALPLTHYAVEVALGDALVLTGKIATVLAGP
jgi:3-hydroxymyristoyl/3-hydroxydecanoyl-(acyl carrier protein) dehydratase